MPSSRPEPIPYIVNKIISLKPRYILDVGVGFGKWGFLAREYTDVWLNHLVDPVGFKKENWKTQIDGIEIFEPYVTDLLKQIYDHIWIGDAVELIPIGNIKYDIIIASDILEHMDHEKGKELITHIKEASKYAYIVTPINVLQQGKVYENVHETHVLGWSQRALEHYGTVTIAGGAYILETNNPS